jgi:predicted Rossmann fold flavoprotein
VAIAAPWVRELSGLTVPDAVAMVLDPAGRVVDERREAVLFAHFGLTGPAILDVSRALARMRSPRLGSIGLDLRPDVPAERLEEEVASASRTGRHAVAGMLGLSRRLAAGVMEAAGVPADRVGPELSREERRRVVGSTKRLLLPVEDTLGFEKAEVTRGGVLLAEVDPRTMESRIRPGLFFCGEVLDLDGRIGGYNFQAAWSTGWLAGESAARS